MIYFYFKLKEDIIILVKVQLLMNNWKMHRQNRQQHFTQTLWAFLREGLLWVLYKDNLPKGIIQKGSSLNKPRSRGHSMQHHYIKR